MTHIVHFFAGREKTCSKIRHIIIVASKASDLDTYPHSFSSCHLTASVHISNNARNSRWENFPRNTARRRILRRIWDQLWDTLSHSISIRLTWNFQRIFLKVCHFWHSKIFLISWKKGFIILFKNTPLLMDILTFDWATELIEKPKESLWSTYMGQNHLLDLYLS